MAKRVFIIYGWDGFPEEGWFPWLKRELEAKGFEVFVPQMPDAGNPRIEKWVPAVASIVGSPDEETYFVGHSMGCQTIARYLESLPEGVVVGGAIFVGGFFKHLTGLSEDPKEQEIDRHWLEAPLDLDKVKTHLKASMALFSDDDPFVPLDNQDDFRDKLGSEIIIQHGKKHFSGHSGTLEIPVVLEKLLEMVK
jgi:predicted alpha/beta hydrolase family esterase